MGVRSGLGHMVMMRVVPDACKSGIIGFLVV